MDVYVIISWYCTLECESIVCECVPEEVFAQRSECVWGCMLAALLYLLWNYVDLFVSFSTIKLPWGSPHGPLKKNKKNPKKTNKTTCLSSYFTCGQLSDLVICNYRKECSRCWTFLLGVVKHSTLHATDPT